MAEKFATRLFMALPAFVVCLSCGGYEVPNTVRKLRCPEDGFCVSHVQGKNWSGGYREGDKEIQVDVFHFTNFETVFNEASNYSIRIRALNGHTMFLGGARQPRQWHEERQVELRNKDDFLDEISSYNALLPRMRSSLAKNPPAQIERKSWDLLLSYLDSFAESKPPDTGNVGVPVPGIENPYADKFDQNGYLGHLEMGTQGSEEDFLEMSSSGGGHHGAIAVAPTEYKEDSRFEYVQKIELFIQPWGIWKFKKKNTIPQPTPKCMDGVETVWMSGSWWIGPRLQTMGLALEAIG